LKTSDIKHISTNLRKLATLRKVTKQTALILSVVSILGLIAVLATNSVQAATTSAFGNANIGTSFATNDANGQSVSYFTSTVSGSVTDIVAYISGSSSGNAITALYAVSNGKATTLLQQSKPVSVGTSFSWVDFQLPSAYSVTSGTTYGLAIMGNIPIKIYEVAGTGQRDHNSVSSYASGFANPFGAIWGTDNTGAMNIYAIDPISPTPTATSSPTATPTPTPTSPATPSPTATPTPTPTATPTSTPNLVPLPSAWESPQIDGTSAAWAVGGVANDVLDYSVTYSGSPSIRIDPVGSTGNNARECDGPWIPIQPGEHIVFSCWIKTSASSFGDTNPYSGGRIGIDFYANGVITATASPDGTPITPSGGSPANQNLNYVHWGTSTWTQITMSFTVAATYAACPSYGSPYSSGQKVVPSGIIPWMQVWSSTYGASDSGKAWFANPTLTITG